MSSCQINVTGTTGSVEIHYTIGSVNNSLIAGIGDPVYISDTATMVTYTNLSGDAIAASGCVSITSVPTFCYLFEWEGFDYSCSNGSVFDAFVLSSPIAITEVPIYRTYNSLSQSIKALANPNIIPYSGKFESTIRGTVLNSLVVKVINSNIPYIRATNPTTTFTTYMKGTVSASCIPTGFTAIDNCDIYTPGS